MSTTHSAYGLRDFLTMLFRRWHVLAYCTGGAVLVAVVGIIFSTPEYKVIAKVLLNAERAYLPLAPTESPVNVYSQVRLEDVNSEVAILTSRSLVGEALKALGVGNEPPKGYSKPLWVRALSVLRRAMGKKEQDYFSGMIEWAADSLQVEPLPKSNVLVVSFISDDPVWAAKFLEVLIKQYQVRRSKLYESPGAPAFFKTQRDKAARKLEAKENALDDFLAEAGVTMIDKPAGADLLEAEKHAALTSHQHFDTQLKESDVQAEKLRSQITKVSAQIVDESMRLERNLLKREKAKHAVELEGLKIDEAGLMKEHDELQLQRKKVANNLKKIRALEDKLRHLLLNANLDPDATNKEENMKEIRALYTQLADLGQLKRYDLATGGDTSLHEELESRIVDSEVKLSGVRERIKRLEKDLAAYDSDGRPDEPLPGLAASTRKIDNIWQTIEHIRRELGEAAARLNLNDQEQIAPVFQTLVAQLVQYEAELAGAVAKREALERQVKTTSELLADLNRKGSRLKKLDRELKLAQAAYLKFNEKYKMAVISGAMTDQRLGNASIAQPPTIPSSPAGMGKSMKLISSVVIGLMGGFGLMLVFQSMDHTISTREELERRLGLVHLASIGEGDTEGAMATGVFEALALQALSSADSDNEMLDATEVRLAFEKDEMA